MRFQLFPDLIYWIICHKLNIQNSQTRSINDTDWAWKDPQRFFDVPVLRWKLNFLERSTSKNIGEDDATTEGGVEEMTRCTFVKVDFLERFDALTTAQETSENDNSWKI